MLASRVLNARVAFIGTGNMGKHMAANLLKAGHEVSVFDVSPKPLEELKARGATVASSPAEAAKGAEQIITMLPSSPHVKEVSHRYPRSA